MILRMFPLRSRREGFASQTLIVLPEAVVARALRSPLLRGLAPVAAGWFPRAEGHRVERKKPLADAVILLCSAGRGWVRVGAGKRHEVGAHSLVVLPAGERHAYGADEREPWSIHWAHARGDEVDAFAQGIDLGGQSPVVRLAEDGRVAAQFAEVYARLGEDYTFPNLLVASAWLRLALAQVFLQCSRPHDETEDDPIGRSIAWMQSHLGERARLDDLAGRAKLSPAHFSARFRRRTGYAPIDFFLRLKIRHACQLLDETSLRVEDVANVVGYEDAFYFSRLFRRVMAMSPRAYRDSVKG